MPADWATQDDLETVHFGDLTARQFDRLVCLLEDLAAGRPVTVVRGGPTLFSAGTPAGPVSPPAAPSTVTVCRSTSIRTRPTVSTPSSSAPSGSAPPPPTAATTASAGAAARRRITARMRASSSRNEYGLVM